MDPEAEWRAQVARIKYDDRVWFRPILKHEILPEINAYGIEILDRRQPGPGFTYRQFMITAAQVMDAGDKDALDRLFRLWVQDILKTFESMRVNKGLTFDVR